MKCACRCWAAPDAVARLLHGLATHGWMMYVFILCNLLAFAAAPALQGFISKQGAAALGKT